jgi:hypothetical protein
VAVSQGANILADGRFKEKGYGAPGDSLSRHLDILPIEFYALLRQPPIVVHLLSKCKYSGNVPSIPR